MTWLITGGAGYIGAHVAHAMVAAGERVVVLDDRSTGVVERLPDAVTLVE
ncbi:NAD-dependent epimerase/dehydratase family protein, partial [Streptomyces sp. DSM 41033]